MYLAQQLMKNLMLNLYNSTLLIVDGGYLEKQQQAFLFYNIRDRTGADEEATKLH